MMAYTPRRSQVFIVRTWTEERGEQLVEMRGMVRNVHSGETLYFRTLKELLRFVASQAKAPGQVTEPDKQYDGTTELPSDVFNADPDRTPDGRD